MVIQPSKIKFSFSLRNFDENTLEITRIANIPSKSPELAKYPQNHKTSKEKKCRNLLIDQNSPKISEMTKITPKLLK